MKRASTKKGPERSKKPRRKAEASRKSVAARAPQSVKQQARKSAIPDQEACRNCNKDLSGNQRALFVEEEIGRIFCTEECIANYFTPEVERLEKEYQKRRSDNDLSADERES